MEMENTAPGSQSAAAGKAPAKDNLDAYLDRVKTLPPTPSLMIKLMALFKEANPDIDHVATLISHDPSLTSEVLKTCNSARYCGEKPVSGMFEAIARLGFYEVYRIVMMISATRTISVENIESVLAVESLCRHSMATAVAASVLAKNVGEPADAAFIAGLFHDVGKIVLASAEGSRYAAVFRQWKTSGASITAAEKQQFGFDHSEVGGRLVDRWGFPFETVIAVQFHHHVADAVAASELTAIVALADMISNGWEKRSASDPASLDNIANAVAILNFTPEKMAEVIGQVHEQLKVDAGLVMNAPAKKKTSQ
jgi:putative nucleotidyltransferase with HDIG domain